MINPVKRKFTAVLVAITLLSITFCSPEITLGATLTETTNGISDYEIINPYKSVNWATFGQYKAGLHTHTFESDGAHSPKDMIEDLYKKNYDIASITDHDVVNTSWDRKDKVTGNYLTTQRLNEINAGTDRSGKGMTGIPLTDEQSSSIEGEHLNTYWANFNNDNSSTLESNIAHCQEAGGISHINHPGGAGNYFPNGQISDDASILINDYTNLYMKYPSCIGMEILNHRYGNRKDYMLFWDNTLMNTMPERPIWGFSSDDAHSMDGAGFNFNIMLMPQNTEKNIRYSMENGTFYAVSLLASSLADMDFKAHDLFPVINNIEVNQNENSITITAENYDVIEWVADSKVIATGNKIDINDYEDKVKNYIRAQIKGPKGSSYTQPFGIKKSVIRIGDINKDEIVNSKDYALLKRHILGIEGYILKGEEISAADVDGSGALNSKDLVYIKRYILNIINTFPVEE